LILSGILETRRTEVRLAFASLELVASPSLGEWVALVLRGA
jgi:ribosomal protein L11 methylase PrmA